MKLPKEPYGDSLAASENAEAWRKLCALLLIELVVTVLTLFHNQLEFGEGTWWITATGVTVAACLAVVAWAGSRRILLTEMALAISSTAVLTCVLLNGQRKMEAGITSNTFDGFKLFIMATALLAFRNWRMGGTLIALSTVFPIAQYYSWTPAWRESVGPAAYSVLLYAVVGAICYAYGYRSQQTARRLLHRDLESSQLKRFARAMLSAKDLSNSPLQILKGSLTLLRRDPARGQEHLARMERACARLEELNGIFSKYETAVDWENSAAIDSLETLAKIAEDWSHEQAKLP